MAPTQPPAFLPYLIALPIIALVLWRNMRGRRLRLETLWILPAILVAGGVVALIQSPAPSPVLMASMAAALTVGAGLGWVRGKMMRLSIDPETHLVTAQASPLAIVFILSLIALRFGGRILLQEDASALHLSVIQLSDLFLLFAVGVVCVQRLEMGLRCMKMIAESKGEKAARLATAS